MLASPLLTLTYLAGDKKLTVVSEKQSSTSGQEYIATPNYNGHLFLKAIPILTLPMLRLLSSKAQGHKFFENHLNPAMLVFIG